MFNLPKELIDNVFSYDITYHEEYSKSIHKIKYISVINEIHSLTYSWVYNLDSQQFFYLDALSWLTDSEIDDDIDFYNNCNIFEPIDLDEKEHIN
jgi:hypothetical protein